MRYEPGFRERLPWPALSVWLLALALFAVFNIIFAPVAATLAVQVLLGGLAVAGAVLAARGRVSGLSRTTVVATVVERLSVRRLPPGEGLLVAFAAVLLMPGLQMAADLLLRFVPGYAEYLSGMQDVIGNDRLGIGYGALFLMIVVMPAFCEELFFRGFLGGAFRARGFTRPAVIVASGILFGLFHLDPYRLVPVTVLGMLMMYVVEITGSVVAGIVYHFVNNGVVFLVAVLAAERPQAGADLPSVPQVVFALLLTCGGILTLAALARRAKLRRSTVPSPSSG